MDDHHREDDEKVNALETVSKLKEVSGELEEIALLFHDLDDSYQAS